MGNGASKSRSVQLHDNNAQNTAKEEFIEDTTQRIVLITGCSSGIGLSLAALLANDQQKRFKVYATMRNLGKKEALEEAGKDVLGERLIVKELDVCSDESVTSVVQEIIQNEQRLDILVNNAGMGLFCVAECVDIDKVKMVFETNVFGLIRVTNSVVPHMKAQKSGHIVNISSVYGLLGLPFGEYYCSSKFAIEGYAESLAAVLHKFNVKTTMIEPGPVVTNFAVNSKALREEVDISSTDDKTKSLLKETLQDYYRTITTLNQTAADIAELVKKVLLLKNPQFRYQPNDKYRQKELASKLSDRTGNAIMGLFSKSFASC
ncbi:hypothetical protein QZH41_013862 [Actinostola sp. cb2023]|nr:hypothetical protein QZH41_013862 [Actinostola sp. cb2023]